MNKLSTIFATIFLSMSVLANSDSHSKHEMQHGFILSEDDRYASHLVATGHHSWQATTRGTLVIPNPDEHLLYLEQKRINGLEPKKYFLFQAQHLDLSSIKVGQILEGHIIESDLGQYQPLKVIVKRAQFQIEEIPINIPNQFFAE